MMKCSRKRCLIVSKILCLIVLIAACAMLVNMPYAHAESRLSREYQIKAAFLYNFAKFVEWPAEAFVDDSAPIIFGVLGEDPFGDILDQTIKDKILNNRKLVIKRIEKFEEDQDLADCHILFISSSEEKLLEKIVETLGDLSVLTVGEMKQFAQRGGIINFVIKRNKVRFEVNVDAAKQVRLRISSKLLNLANVVTGTWTNP